MAALPSRSSSKRIVEKIYPIRSEYEQVIITAPGPQLFSSKEEEEGDEYYEEVAKEATDLRNYGELKDAFNAAVLAFTKALVRARVEPVSIEVNVDMEDVDSSAIVLKAVISPDIEVKVEASLEKIKYMIVFPRRNQRSRRLARKFEDALMNVLLEPISRMSKV